MFVDLRILTLNACADPLPTKEDESEEDESAKKMNNKKKKVKQRIAKSSGTEKGKDKQASEKKKPIQRNQYSGSRPAKSPYFAPQDYQVSLLENPKSPVSSWCLWRCFLLSLDTLSSELGPLYLLEHGTRTQVEIHWSVLEASFKAFCIALYDCYSSA